MQSVIPISLVLLSLLGCEKASIDDTSALENPPPKPPNCPELAETRNVRIDGGGVIADVRIIRIGKHLLYIPAAWLGDAYFLDQSSRGLGGFYQRSEVDLFQPNIHSSECAGVVHLFNGHAKTPAFALRIPREDRSGAPVQGLLDHGVTWMQISEATAASKDLYDPLAPGGPGFDLVIDDNIVVSIFPKGKTPPNGNQIGILKDEVVGIFSWLTTPPAKRGE